MGGIIAKPFYINLLLTKKLTNKFTSMKKHLLFFFVFLFSLATSATTFDDWTSDTRENSTSEKTYALTVDKGSTLSFDWFVSSEENYDIFYIYLDEVCFWQTSGEHSGHHTIEFTTAGTRYLKVIYIKDGSVDNGNDNCGISNIELTADLSQASDINGDGKINVADVTTLVSIILGNDNGDNGNNGDINRDGKINVADITVLVSIILGTNEGDSTPCIPDPTAVGEAIDLGLPSGIKWANYNVGATAPEECGAYYAWGETEEKEEYSWQNYKHLNHNENLMSKYWSHDDGWGIIDNKSTLDAEDDVAQVYWGNGWRMPSSEEQEELYYYCNWEKETLNGVDGVRITGPNGNSIFLPATGYRINTEIFNKGSVSYFWSNTVHPDNNNNAYNSGYNLAVGYGWDYADPRYFGWVVRPVYDESTMTKYTVTVTSSGRGTVTIDGETAEKATFVEDSSVTIVATPGDGRDFAGWYTNDGETLVSRDESYTFTASSDVEFVARFTLPTTPAQAIDLGLPSGFKWASYNVGATAPEEYGGYYAWGETEEKNNYNWQGTTYKYCDGNTNALTKYCIDSNYGTVDGKTKLDADDDVATVLWGGEWRMPTIEEQEELLNYCNWEWTSLYGVNGYSVTGPNGNSIFLPAAGYYNDTELRDCGEDGYYWSSNTGIYYYARYLMFIRDYSCMLQSTTRTNGYTVRPIQAPRVNYCNVKVTNIGLGTVAIDGYSDKKMTFVEGRTITVKAVPVEGRHFTGWYTDGSTTLVSTDTVYTFTVSSNVELAAKFSLPATPAGTAIDLGLPSGLKWASHNVGATAPEGYGGYYAWGETEEVSETYKYYVYSDYGWPDSVNKYCTDSHYGTPDNKSLLEACDDVASVKWGSDWRMPTLAEQMELLYYCTWTEETLNGVKGYRVTGNNGNSIFLPLAGYYSKSSTTFANQGKEYSSHSSILNVNSCMSAYGCYIYNTYKGATTHNREDGYPVRPVCGATPIDTGLYPESYPRLMVSNAEYGGGIYLFGKTLTDRFSEYMSEGYTITITAVPDEGYEFEGWYNGDYETLVSTAATYTFTMGKDAVQLRPKFNLDITEGEVIDLGLSIKWASCNLGATIPEEAGTAYAWGEIKEKEAFTWGNYKFAADPNFLYYSKYCLDSDYGTVDDKKNLELIDDVARGKLSGTWRIPTKREMQELVDNCSWIKGYFNDIEGWRVSGPNGNSIFLPYTHKVITHAPVTVVRDAGCYWTASLESSPKAYRLYFVNNDSGVISTESRQEGLVIRPVCE